MNRVLKRMGMDGISLLLLSLALGIAVISIEQSRWINPQPPLLLVLGLALLAGWVWGKSRLPGAAALPLALLLGLLVTVWQAASLLPAPSTTSWLDSWQSWWRVISHGRPIESTLYFATFIVLVTWLMGYTSAWFLARRKNPWVAVFLGTVTVLVNLANLTEDYQPFFLFYLVAALLLVGQTGLVKQGLPRRGAGYLMVAVTALVALLVTGAWSMPEVQASQLQNLLSTRLPRAEDINKHWMNLFAAVPAKQSFMRSSEQETLAFASPVNLSEEIQFMISSSERLSFWRTRRYDIYQPWGWSTSPTTERLVNNGTPIESETSPSSREILYTVTSKLRTDVFLAGGEVSTLSSPTLARTITAGSETDIITLIAPRLLRPNEKYSATGTVNTAPAAELAQAGAAYPRWVTDRYLQLPPGLPERVKETARSITRQAASPYQKAVAIKTFLSRFTYLEIGTAPPRPNLDGVDYFLNVQRAGNCTNFASAMTVMLRAVGVPARFAAGYLSPGWDEDTSTLFLRARDYHARPEVYFPGYGWMEFEATPLAIPEDLSELDDAGLGLGDILGDEAGDTGGGLVAPDWSWITPALAVLGAALLLFLAVTLFRRWLVSFNPADYASAVYARMCLLASLVRVHPFTQQTPLEFQARLISAFPLQQKEISTVTGSYLRSRYSPRKRPTPEEREELHRSWTPLSRALLRRLLRLGRR